MIQLVFHYLLVLRQEFEDDVNIQWVIFESAHVEDCQEYLWQNLDLPIALRKGIRSTRNPYPIYNFVSYHRLSSSYHSFVSSLSSVSLPKNLCEALDHPGWRQAMIDEMQALEHNGTWELVPLPPGKKPVGC